MDRGYTCLWRKSWSDAVLAEPGRRFSRLEAWFYITNMLAAPEDDRSAGCKRGVFIASLRQLAGCFGWSRAAVQRFLDILLKNSMILRMGQQAGHFIVCDYEIYCMPQDDGRNTDRNREGAEERLIGCAGESYAEAWDAGRDKAQECVCE